jgi:Spy/CpxP family protein refolding chaperone
MKKFSAIIPIFILLGGSIMAQGPGRFGAGKSGERGPRAGRFAERGFEAVSEYLNLDENQQTSFRQLLDDRKSAAEAVFQLMSEDGSSLRDLMETDNPDPATVGNLVISMHNKRQELGDIQSQFIANFKSILSPEQLELYENVVSRTGRDRIVPAFRALRLFKAPGNEPRGFHGMGMGFEPRWERDDDDY